MFSEPRKQLMAWMEMDYSKHMHFQWKIKWRLEHCGMQRVMGEMVPQHVALSVLDSALLKGQNSWSQLVLCMCLVYLLDLLGQFSGG